MRSFGASATPISWRELVPALKQNVVDGQENAAGTILAGKLYEVQKLLSVNEHIYGLHLILINDAVFKKLSPDQQQILIDGAKAREQASAVDELRKLGMTVHVNSPSEKELFRKASQQAVIEYIASQIGRDLVDKLLASVEESKKRVHQRD
jgi:C4-dicarboxylate-binding protein DctP